MPTPAKLGLFEGPAPRIRTVSPGAPFLDLLADRLIAELAEAGPFALSDAIVFLPNRRAARGLIEAFAARQPGAMLLPSIRPLGDLDDDPDLWGPDPAAIDLPPAIDPLRRRLELAALIRARDIAEGGVSDPPRALASADQLCALMDSAAAVGELDWGRLHELAAERDLAAHWRRAADFLSIATEYWPKRLAADGLTDPMDRRMRLLRALADRWEESPTASPVVIAGSTGSLAAARRLMQVAARLPRGVVVLPGLDFQMDDPAWEAIDPVHPQAALRLTLQELGVERGEVSTLVGDEEPEFAVARRALLREALAPADITADWLQRLERAGGAGLVERATDGVSLIEAQTEDEEATAVALLLREIAERPSAAAALVTPDRALARRVSAKLARWNIEANVSAGEPLADTAAGILLRLLTELAQDDGDPVALAALAKHRRVALIDRRDWAELERECLRGARRHGDFADLAAKIRGEAGARAAQTLVDALAPLNALPEETDLVAASAALVEAAERLAGGGAAWEGPDGENAANLLQVMGEHGLALGAVARRQLPRILVALMAGRAVRPEPGGHPRISLWGPLEARLQRCDLIVLGGLNEGAWPAPAPDDPFLSRSMREALGLPPTEARIGLAAHDFAQFANAPRVVLTRALRAEGAPSSASRWLWRLQTLVRGADGPTLPADPALEWARALDPAGKPTPATPPRPRPPADKRLTRLSVTDVEKLIRDPYAVYAKRLLGLEPLRPLGAKPSAAERGTALHKALELFSIEVKSGGDADPARLLALIDAELKQTGFPAVDRLADSVRLAAAATTFAEWIEARRTSGIQTYLEDSGSLTLPEGRLTGQADRIDIDQNGFASLVDVKTGDAPTDSQFKAGLAPQLPLEGAMLMAAAFQQAPAATPGEYVYWRFGGGDSGPRAVTAEGDAAAFARETLAKLQALLKAYQDPNRAFLSKPRAKLAKQYADYDHLARRKEWAEEQDEE